MTRPPPLNLPVWGFEQAFDSLPDSALVALARGARDAGAKDAAFDGLVKRHAPRLHAVASRIVGREEAFDVVQEGFLAAHRGLSGFRQEAQFSTWMHRIVLNCAYASLRRGQFPKEDLGLPFDASDSRPSPQDQAEQQDLRTALEAALTRIKAEFRETFVLVEFGQLDYAAVAEVLGVQVGTVKSRMSRAREALRELLEAQGFRP